MTMQANADKIWSAAQQQLRSMLSADIYNLWFSPRRAHSLENDSLVLEVADDFCEVWLKENYLVLLQEVLASVTGRAMAVKFKVVAENSSAAPAVVTPASKSRN